MNKLERKLLEFDAARQNRRFEIDMFWRRANYFLVLNTALAVGFFSLKENYAALAISLFGIIASYLWFRTNIGARFWQVFWESEVHDLAKDLNIKAFALTDDDIHAQRLTFGRTKNKSWFRRQIDKQVDQGASVSYNMILLSFWAIVFWIGSFLTIVGKVSYSYCSCSL